MLSFDSAYDAGPGQPTSRPMDDQHLDAPVGPGMTHVTGGFVPAPRARPRAGTLHQAAATEPIYADLAGCWEAFGRMVPGRPDAEWERLVSQIPWPTDTAVDVGGTTYRGLR